MDWSAIYSPEQPALAPLLTGEEGEEVEELKDHELVQLDTVLALVRMDILARIRYILTVIKDSVSLIFFSVSRLHSFTK